MDFRNTKELLWKPLTQNNTHEGKISDILLFGNSIITSDSSGIICEWKNQQIQ